MAVGQQPYAQAIHRTLEMRYQRLDRLTISLEATADKCSLLGRHVQLPVAEARKEILWADQKSFRVL
jgi:hypothetical protein